MHDIAHAELRDPHREVAGGVQQGRGIAGIGQCQQERERHLGDARKVPARLQQRVAIPVEVR